jgi:hypothetical protein
MRRSPVLALVLSAAFAISAVASASQTTLPIGSLELTLGGSIVPKALPRSAYAPVAIRVGGEVATTDGSYPSALREVEVNVEKNIKVDARDLPVCHVVLEERVTGGFCPGSRVGGGRAHISIAFPEAAPLIVASPIEVFNGGESGGRTKLLVRAVIPIPVPSAIFAKLTIQRRGSGLHSIIAIPRIAGGDGSLLDFRLRLGRTYAYRGREVGYFEAKCPTGAFDTTTKALFKNETNVPGVAPTTTLSGKLSVPCRPTG